MKHVYDAARRVEAEPGDVLTIGSEKQAERHDTPF